MLVAGGLSNRQIADRLSVSVRTVDGHLYRIFAKLGIGRCEQVVHLVRARSKAEGVGLRFVPVEPKKGRDGAVGLAVPMSGNGYQNLLRRFNICSKRWGKSG
jgi:Bacterial regulatory proteins, luxR family